MRKHGRALALAATLAALALAVGGCGGGDDESSDGATTAAAAETETTAETTEPTTTEAETTEETTSAASGIADEDCIELASIGAKFSAALGATGQNTDLEQTTAFFEELADKAPGEIKDDLAVLSAAWVEVAAALKDIDLSSGAAPSAATLVKLQKLSTKFNTPELQQASKNLTAWSNEHCGTGTTTTP
jgi:hypothetical protein